MAGLIIGALFLLLVLAAVRKVAACPLVRTLAISANCWAETEEAGRKAA